MNSFKNQDISDIITRIETQIRPKERDSAICLNKMKGLSVAN